MRAHPRVIGFLQRAVNHEFNAVQQYTLQAVRAETLGLNRLATELRAGCLEEIQHAEVLIGRLYMLGATPRAGQPRAPQVGRTHVEMLRFGLATEGDAIRLYEEACTFCKRIGDEEHRALFARILADEMRHYKELERAINALEFENA